MKKFLSFFIMASLSFSLVACGNTDNNYNSDVIDSPNYKVGIGSYTSSENTSSVGGDNGKGVISTTYATVVFDENNIIKKVYIDEVETKIVFDAKGQIIEGNYQNIKSKRELGDSYGMKAASPIGKEWYEQVNSLESYLVGKNIEEIANAVVYGGMYGTQDDYASSTGNDMSSTSDIIDSITSDVEKTTSDIVDGAESVVDEIKDGLMGSSSMDTNSNSENMMNSNSTNPYENAINWQVDLKSSVTINLTDIQKALQKAYQNAK